MFLSLLLRPFCLAILLLVGTTALLVIWSQSELESIEERQVSELLPHRLTVCARAFERALNEDRSRAKSELTELARRAALQLTWVDAAGHVLEDSNAQSASRSEFAKLPELQAAMNRGGRGFAFDAAGGYAAAVTALENTANFGYLRGTHPLLTLERRQARLRQVIYTTSALLGCGLFAFFAWNARRVRRDALRLAAQAEAIAQGQSAQRFGRYTGSEIAPLAESLQRVADDFGVQLSQLDRDRNQLSAILASMIEGVVAVDTRGMVLHANAIAGEILRFDPSQALGRRLRESTRIRQVSELLDQVLAAEAHAEREATLPGAGEPRVVQLRASALLDARGSLNGAVIVIHDITALRRLEEIRREFVANVSHELKTPLTAIQGFIEAIVGDPEMPEDLRSRFLLRIQAQSERLASLVHDLLSLARIEAEGKSIALKATDPAPIIQRALDSVQSAATAREVELRTEIEHPAPKIEGDIGALEQIVTNLLDNAIKYSRTEGHVLLRLYARDNDVYLEFEDDGIGIEERHQSRIFERFYRVDRARSRDVGGTGLGLSIVKHLCLALGGDIQVRSELGQGSTFTARFQRARE